MDPPRRRNLYLSLCHVPSYVPHAKGRTGGICNFLKLLFLKHCTLFLSILMIAIKLSFVPTFQMDNLGSERSSNLPKVAQLISSRAGKHRQPMWRQRGPSTGMMRTSTDLQCLIWSPWSPCSSEYRILPAFRKVNKHRDVSSLTLTVMPVAASHSQNSRMSVAKHKCSH